MTEIVVSQKEKLNFHLQQVLKGKRKFENAFEAINRMILEAGTERIIRAGMTVYDYKFFRMGKYHPIGWYEEINRLVSYVKEGAEGGPAKERAFVYVGPPGIGKTFLVQYLCDGYRKFLAQPENRRYTFQFVNLKRLGSYGSSYGNINVIESQTSEDPMILVLNLFPPNEVEQFLEKQGFNGEQIAKLYQNYRPLGACSEYILKDIIDYCQGDTQKAIDEFIRIVPASLSASTITAKYSAGEKITASAAELRGEEDVGRLLHLADPGNPFRINVKKGVLARSAGGGIHFSDELFKNKKDLINIYLQVIQNRNIEVEGFRWPIDTLIICTSNDEEYKRFISEEGEGPIKDRCDICFVGHNTDYKLQRKLTLYALGGKKITITGRPMHVDPNLEYAVSVAVVLTRLPRTDKLTPEEILKLEAGEIAGEKSINTLIEIKKTLNANPDVTRRWGQRGLSHRDLGRILQLLSALPESNRGECMVALNVFECIEEVIKDYVADVNDREKFMEDLKIARELYRKRIKTSIYNAFRDDPQAISKDVLSYVNMVIGMESEKLGPEKIWTYRDPLTGELKGIKIDEKYIDAVEERLGLKTKEAKETHRNTIRRIYTKKISEDPTYDFMDNESLVKAITEVRLESEVGTAGSLIGALTNRTHEENVKIYNRLIQTMLKKLGYCKTCAEKTIEYFCQKKDEK